MIPSVAIDRKKKTVTVVMALEKAHPSKSSGKTRVIATTRGCRSGAENYCHQAVWFTANVFFYPQDSKSNKRGGSPSEVAGA